MAKDPIKQKRKTIQNTEPTTRKQIRWMLTIYDSILYAICWSFFLAVHPSMVDPVPYMVMSVYMLVGYALFFGARFVLNCYRQIWRHGLLRSFLKELAACVLSVCVLALTNRLLSQAPLALILSFGMGYTLLSLGFRALYWYLYHWAVQGKKGSGVVRLLLEMLALVDFSSKNPGATLRLVLEPDKGSTNPINEEQRIAEQFAIRGDVTKITQINKGYINRTYKVETLSDTGHVHQYTLQRINTNVFPDVDALMDNFKLTTDHLHGKLLLPGHGKKGSVQTIRPTKDGRAYLKDASGCWRVMTYFDGVYSLDIPDSPKTFYHAGCAFGMFMKEMSDVSVEEVKEVIPNFHNTKSRYRDLESAIEKNPKDRVKDVQPEIKFLRKRSGKFGIISEALESGKIPTRVCHNDCNLNNILFDNDTHLPVAIIDLDTVMPSTPLYDYGDSMRIGTNTAKDDEKDLTKVSCDLGLYEQYARGYLEACGSVLTREELELLPFASLIITAEDGIRFLMDHINGDTYYNIYYPGQNLDRARTQLKLLEDMEKKLPQIRHILQRIYDDLGLDANVLW